MLLETDGMNQPMLASKGRPYTLCSPHGKASRFRINIKFYTMLLGHVHIYMGNRVCHLSLYCRGTPKPLAASTSNLACKSALVQEHIKSRRVSLPGARPLPSTPNAPMWNFFIDQNLVGRTSRGRQNCPWGQFWPGPDLIWHDSPF